MSRINHVFVFESILAFNLPVTVKQKWKLAKFDKEMSTPIFARIWRKTQDHTHYSS